MFCVSDATIDKPYCAHNHDHLIAPSYHITGNIGHLHSVVYVGSISLRPQDQWLWFVIDMLRIQNICMLGSCVPSVTSQWLPSADLVTDSVKSRFVIYKTMEVKAWQQSNSISTLAACSPPAPPRGTRGPHTWPTPEEPPARGRDTGTQGTGEVVFTLVRWHGQRRTGLKLDSTPSIYLIDPFHIVYCWKMYVQCQCHFNTCLLN